MAVIGEIAVNVVANTQPLERGVSRAKGAVKSFESSLMSTRTALLGWTGALVAAGYAINRQISAIDELNDQAQKLDATFNGLAGLQYTATMTGDSFETLVGALGQMQARLGDVAATGKGAAADALKRLGLNAGQLVGLKAEDAFAEIAEKLKGVSTTAERTALSMDLFGKSGKDIVNTIKLGSSGLQEMRKEADALGLTLNESTVKAVANLDDEIKKLMGAVRGAPRQAVGGGAGWLAEALAGRRQAFVGENMSPNAQSDIHNPYFMIPFFGRAMSQYYRTGVEAPAAQPGEITATSPYKSPGPELFGQRFFGAAGGLYNRYLGSNVNMAGGALSMLPQAMGMMEGKLNSMSWEIFKRKAFGYLYKTEKEEAKKESPIAVGLNRAIDYNSNEATMVRAQAKREAEILDELKRQTKLMEATKPEQSIKLEGWKIN